MSQVNQSALTNRIYFVGAHSTGKTTIARWVSRRYSIPLVAEIARSVIAELEMNLDSLRTEIDRVDDFQRRVFERQITTEKAQTGGFVSDRAFDNLAYAAEHATILGDIMAQSSSREYISWFSEGLVFFIRPQHELLKEDGVRAGANWDSVVRIDGMIKLLLEQFRVRYLSIDTASMQERVRTVEFVMRLIGAKKGQQNA